MKLTSLTQLLGTWMEAYTSDFTGSEPGRDMRCKENNENGRGKLCE